MSYILSRIIQGLGRPAHARRPVRVAFGEGRGLLLDPGRSDPGYGAGDNELPVQRALAAQLEAGDVFWDIGANIGFFSMIAARLVGPRGRVLAFEPVGENAQCLRDNAARNGLHNVAVMEVAVSDRAGRVRLTLTEHAGGATLEAPDLPAPPDARGTQAVCALALDDLVLQRGFVPPDFVKLDVEGAELRALAGMVAILERHRPRVLFEVDGPDEATVGSRAKAVVDFLSRHGYESRRLSPAYRDQGWVVEHQLATAPV